MRRLLLITILSVATISCATPQDDFEMGFIPIYGTPPANVARWTRIVWGGAMNHPIIPVYFLTDMREASEGSLTRYVVLKPQEYESLTQFTRSNECPVEHVSAKPPWPPSIIVEEYSGGRIRELCVFPPNGGCEYLFGIANSPEIDWSQKDTFPIFQFEAELGCKGTLTKPHDAKGNGN